MATVQGAFNESCPDVENYWGWTVCSRGQLEVDDTLGYELVMDSDYKLPKCLPNGIYGDETECYAMASCAAGFALLAAFILNV